MAALALFIMAALALFFMAALALFFYGGTRLATFTRSLRMWLL